jgi:UDP-hydrolysing UDP-N-acetyl-D-glucosamine 2-epimerase
LQAIERQRELRLSVVATGSLLLDRYGEAVKVLEDDGFAALTKVYTVVEGENPVVMAKTTGLALLEISTALANLSPDMVVTIADRYETLATAAAAAYLGIPLAHIQGGEVSGNIDEKVRHAVTKLSDYHLVSSKAAASRLVRMGEDPARVFVTGCPSIDLAADIMRTPQLDFDPMKKYGGVGPALTLDAGYVVAMQHPVTTEPGHAREHAWETLRAVNQVGLPALWFWPNPDAGSDGTSRAIRSFRENVNPPNIHFFKNMTPPDFLRLLANARCLVGNSSVGIREASYIGVPVVNIGNRQQGRDRGANVLDVGHESKEIEAAIRAQLSRPHFESDPLYGNGHAGERIAEVLAEVDLSLKPRLTY